MITNNIHFRGRNLDIRERDYHEFIVSYGVWCNNSFILGKENLNLISGFNNNYGIPCTKRRSCIKLYSSYGKDLNYAG